MATPRDQMTPIEEGLQEERAYALGQAGKRVEAALAAVEAAAGAIRAERERVLDEAGTAVWHYLILRESLGMYDHAEALAVYRVPGRVLARVGVIRQPR